MDNDDSNPYDPDALPVWDEHSEPNSPRTLCESYAQDLIERAAERRREIARDHADDKRHLEAAIELDRLAVEVRALAKSPLEAAFDRALLLADDSCEKINVLAIRKENELVRSIGFGGHCATGVDFIATVMDFWLDATLDSMWEPELERPEDVADGAAVDKYINLRLKERDLRDIAHWRAINTKTAEDIRYTDRDLADLSPTLMPEDRRAADDWLQSLADLEWGKAL
jgi:hypothetical protein